MRATGDVGARLPLTGRRSRRAWQAAAILLACGWAADRHVLPALAGRGVARALADGGYPDARFEVERVGLDRLQLRGVHLADGVDLGEVELDVGLSALWGDRPARATVRGARVALDAVAPGRRPAGPAPVDRVHVERAELTRGRDRATITGEISLAGPLAVDLRATGLRIGGRAIDELAVRARKTAGGYDAAWELRGARWTARGEGSLVRRAGALELARSHTELRARSLRAGRVALAGVDVALDAAGPLDALAVRGEARADRAALDGRAALTLHGVRAPIAVRATSAGGALAVLGRPVVARAREATLELAGHPVRATEVELELDGGAAGDGEERAIFAPGRGAAWPDRVRWRAALARGGPLRAEQLTGSYLAAAGTYTVSARAVAAHALELGAGAIELRLAGEQLRLERGRLAVAGGELTAGPAVISPAAGGAAPAELVIAARGLRLGRLLPRHAVEATSVLDGELAVRPDGAGGATFVRGELRARGRGKIRIRDRALRERARAAAGLEQRLVAALADFEHTALAAELGPRGVEPALRVTARGRGSRVPQELDLAINFRGVWAALDRLARSY